MFSSSVWKRLAAAFGFVPLCAVLLAAWKPSSLGSPVEVAAADGVVGLEGVWKLRAGDEEAWSLPDLDDSGWAEIRVPTGRGVRHEEASEMVWYRLTVRLAGGHGERGDRRLGLTVGKVDSAYEVFAGGLRLGGVGSLPPDPRMVYDRHRTYEIPPRAVDAGGRLALALRVWKSPLRRGDVGALYDGPFLIGPHDELVRRELLRELPALALAILILVAGLFHLQLYLRRPELREYLWFFLLTLCVAAYGVLRTQWKYALCDRFLLLKETEHLMLYLMAALFIQLLWPLAGAAIPRWMRFAQWLFLAAGVAVAASPGLALNARVHPWWMVAAIGLVAAGLRELARGAWRRHPGARTVVAGALACAAASFHDLAVYRAWIDSPPLFSYGFGIFVLSMGFSLADRFIRVFFELEATAERERRIRAEREELIAQLEERNVELARFNYAVSHDLKNPLLTVKNFLGLLRRDLAAGDAERCRRDLDRIDSAADHMRRLVNELLAYSGVGHRAPAREAVAFGELVSEARDLLAGSLAERGVELEVAPDLPVAIGDRLRLLQVVQNLLDNAAKYMGGQPEPRIEVGVRRDGAETVLFVRDNGGGIDPRYHDRVFALFERLETGADGTGIGLALVQRIVEVHGGRVWVESEGEGRGSTFCVVLPWAAAA